MLVIALNSFNHPAYILAKGLKVMLDSSKPYYVGHNYDEYCEWACQGDISKIPKATKMEKDDNGYLPTTQTLLVSPKI
jgi:hypothetical protein